jgi:hypothetical protein
MKFTIRVVNEANIIPNWIKPMLDIIVDEYLDSATSTNVLIGMSLVSRWAESKRGLPAEFSNVFFVLSSNRMFYILHPGCQVILLDPIFCWLSLISDIICLTFNFKELFTGAS